MALVNDPKVLFFDEPTAGLDPQVRREIYDIIEELRREKKTIVMTTHYIEEAERLCDRVAIVDHGKVIALGTPRDLKAHSGGTTRIEVRLSKPESNGTLKNLDGATDAREVDGTYVIHSKRPPQTIVSLVKHLEAQDNELVSLEIASPSLEDVDRKSTRLNSSHGYISYAVFCLKKKKEIRPCYRDRDVHRRDPQGSPARAPSRSSVHADIFPDAERHEYRPAHGRDSARSVPAGV